MSKLFRSRTDKKLTGLCGGMAEAWNIDPTLIRLVTVGATFFSGGTVIPLYFIASIIVPKDPIHNGYHDYNNNPFGGNPFGGNPFNGNPFEKKNYNGGNSYYNQGPSAPTYTSSGYKPHGSAPQAPNQAPPSQLDDMMKDLETKALKKELDELRQKLAKLESQNLKNEPKGDE